jgi:hypothetical protein
MPFVRYANGDLATASARLCACGRGLPLLERVDGRKLDAIRTRGGQRLPGEFFPHMFKDVAGIDRFLPRRTPFMGTRSGAVSLGRSLRRPSGSRRDTTHIPPATESPWPP